MEAKYIELFERTERLREDIASCNEEAILHIKMAMWCKSEAAWCVQELAMCTMILGRVSADQYLYAVWDERIQ